jgi:hypothetical protein
VIYKDIVTILFGGAWVILGLLLATGKVRIVIQYPKEEQPAPWPEKKEDEEPVANYVKPAEKEKPVEKVAPKRRSRPARTTKVRPPVTSAL